MSGGTLLTRKHITLGLCSRRMPWNLWWSQGGRSLSAKRPSLRGALNQYKGYLAHTLIINQYKGYLAQKKTKIP